MNDITAAYVREVVGVELSDVVLGLYESSKPDLTKENLPSVYDVARRLLERPPTVQELIEAFNVSKELRELAARLGNITRRYETPQEIPIKKNIKLNDVDPTDKPIIATLHRFFGYDTVKLFYPEVSAGSSQAFCAQIAMGKYGTMEAVLVTEPNCKPHYFVAERKKGKKSLRTRLTELYGSEFKVNNGNLVKLSHIPVYNIRNDIFEKENIEHLTE